MLLLEWRQQIALAGLDDAKDGERAATPHQAAARIAIALLAEHFGSASHLPLNAASPSDDQQLDFLAEGLYLRPSEELRLALKAIYRREFVYGEIDEPPFMEIGPSGDCVPRPLPPADYPPAPSFPNPNAEPCPT
jgi:hypothetical protein